MLRVEEKATFEFYGHPFGVILLAPLWDPVFPHCKFDKNFHNSTPLHILKTLHVLNFGRSLLVVVRLV